MSHGVTVLSYIVPQKDTSTTRDVVEIIIYYHLIRVISSVTDTGVPFLTSLFHASILTEIHLNEENIIFTQIPGHGKSSNYLYR